VYVAQALQTEQIRTLRLAVLPAGGSDSNSAFIAILSINIMGNLAFVNVYAINTPEF